MAISIEGKESDESIKPLSQLMCIIKQVTDFTKYECV